MEIRRLVVMAFPEPTNRTTEIVVRDLFLEALDDPDLTFHIHAQRPRGLASAVQAAQYIRHAFASQLVEQTSPNGGAGRKRN